MKPRLLLVEDDFDMRVATKVVLERGGYSVVETDYAEQALQEAFASPFDLVIADVGLPGISGVKLCELLRNDPRTSGVPIILLTSMRRTHDKVEGLRTGADDYITKPYEPAELVARVGALLRRTKGAAAPPSTLEWNGLRLELESRHAMFQGRTLELRRKEFDLLVLFMKHRGKLLTRERLSALLWDDGTLVSENTLYVHINTLRERLGSFGAHLQTRVGAGYILDDTK